MKTRLQIIFILFIGFILLSCENELVDLTSAVYQNEHSQDSKEIMTKSITGALTGEQFNLEDYPYTMEEDSVLICDIGGPVSSICDLYDSYLVNGEVRYYKESLLNQRNSSAERLYGYTLGKSYQHIYFSIHSEYSYDEAANMFISAINEWNSLPECNLYLASYDDYKYSGNTQDWPMVKVYMKPDVDDSQIYNKANCDIKYGIVTDAPYTKGTLGYRITVDTSDDSEYTALSSDMKKYALMHSIGHVIGLKEVRFGMSISNNHINGTSLSTDTFMRSYDELQEYEEEWKGFTEYDKSDLSRIYPVIVEEINLEGPDQSKMLKQYKPYIFKSSCKSIKNTEKIHYTYEVVSLSPQFYTSETLSDGSFKIVFNRPGMYKVRTIAHSDGCILPEKYTDEKQYYVIGEKFTMPEEVKLNEEFNVFWRYPDPTNPENPEATIEVTGIETLFDNNSDNIVLSADKGNVIAKITDYGKYVITLKAISSTGEVLKQKKINVEKFYNPHYRGVVSEYDRLGFEPACFSIDGEVCQDDLSHVNSVHTLNNAYEILFMISDKFPQRFCVYRYNKYRRISGLARRVDVRDLVDTTSYTPILFKKGALPIYDVPITWFEINSEQIGMEEGTMTTYICYYAFIIPEDKIYVIEE